MNAKGLPILILLWLVVIPTNAVEFPQAEFQSGNVTVAVSISSNNVWHSPFAETVHANFSVTILEENVIQVSITQVTLSVTKRGLDNFVPVTGNTMQLTNVKSNTNSITFEIDFTLQGSDNSPECYFAVEITGIFSNVTGNFEFQAISPDNFIGPFSIMPSLTSPVAQVGLVLVVIFIIVIVAGIIGVKKSKALPPRRKSLLEE